MVVDFSKLDLSEQPVLVLKNIDGTQIQTLGYAAHIDLDLHFNETSTLTFDVPAYANGEKTPCYDEIIGMRMIDLVGVGQFILIDPEIVDDGAKQIKTCKAYSLEYELTYKTITLEESTYNFYDPLSPTDTILGIMIQEYAPSWRIGYVSPSLLNKYRTFDISNENLYNVMKSTLQEKYRCIFDFDTYTRTINVYSVDDELMTEPVFMSLDNLLKDIKISEDTENVFTCIDVSGADDVDIRAVNPTGTNKLYDISYLISQNHFSAAFVEKWNAWKNAFDSVQELFYQTVVEQALQSTNALTQDAALQRLDGELTGLEALKSTYLSAIAQGLQKDDDGQFFSEKLAIVNNDIAAKNDEISAAEQRKENALVASQSLLDDLQSMREQCAFTEYFTDYVCPYCGGLATVSGTTCTCQECGSVSSTQYPINDDDPLRAESELSVLMRSMKESALEDSSFVAPTVKAYKPEEASGTASYVPCAIQNAEITCTVSSSGKKSYTISGGTVTMIPDGDTSINAKIVNAALVVNPDMSFVLSAYLNTGMVGTTLYDHGNLTVSGTIDTITDDLTLDDQIYESEYYTGTSVTVTPTTCDIYFTTDTSDYEQMSVAWELYQYAVECMADLCYPAYTFSVSSANFIASEQFDSFKKRLTLGRKIYLDLGDRVIEPVFIGMKFNYEDLGSIDLEFSDKFSGSDAAMSLANLLDESISMGKSVSRKSGGWSAFVDSQASSSVKEFMDSALDVAKNKVLSSVGQSITWDESGIRLRKWLDDEHTLYDDHQIWMTDRNIVFTDDNWTTAKMAIGMLEDPIYGTVYGVCAPYIVGTMLAGENLRISNTGGNFVIDENGITINGLSLKIASGNPSETTPTKSLQEALNSVSTMQVFYQDTEPEDAKLGDIWVNSSTGEACSYMTDGWNQMEYSELYHSDVIPESASAGVLWYNTSEEPIEDGDGRIYEGSKIYRFNGEYWDVIEDRAIAQVMQITNSRNGNIFVDATKVSGAIDSTLASMSACSDHMLYDSTGMWLMNGDDPTTASKAIWMNQNGILLANARTGTDDEDPSYNETSHKSLAWNTAITADGIVADYLIGDHLHATFDISAGRATGTDYSTCPFYVSEDGKLKAKDANIQGTVDADRIKLRGQDITDLFSPYIDTSSGATTASGLDLGSITIADGKITFYDNNRHSTPQAAITTTPAKTSGHAFHLESEGAMRFVAKSGSVYLEGSEPVGANGFPNGKHKAQMDLTNDGVVSIRGEMLMFNDVPLGSGTPAVFG